MADHELGRDLGALAEHGERTGHLAPAAAVRARADRRRRNRQVASGALAFLVVGGVGVGIALNQQPRRAAPPATPPSVTAAPSTTPPSSPPPSSPPPSRRTPSSPPSSTPPTSTSTSAKTSSNVFSGEREVLLLPENSEATVAIDGNKRAALSEDFGDSALFVLNKVSGDQYWIQTARLRAGGEAYCLEAAATSGEAVPVTAEACDAAQKRQLWRFRKVGEADGKPTYTIRTGSDIYLVQDPDGQLLDGGTGIIAIGIGEGTPDIDTPFQLPDRGEASMPSLD